MDRGLPWNWLREVWQANVRMQAGNCERAALRPGRDRRPAFALVVVACERVAECALSSGPIRSRQPPNIPADRSFRGPPGTLRFRPGRGLVSESTYAAPVALRMIAIPSRSLCGSSMDVGSGRTSAVPGRCWKAAVPPNPAFEAVPTKVPLIVRLSSSALSAFPAFSQSVSSTAPRFLFF
jgi:hypothetical protein